MKIIVANLDRTGDLGQSIRQAAANRMKDSGLSPEAVLMSCGQARNPEEFREYIRRYGQIAASAGVKEVAPLGPLARLRLRLRHARNRLVFGWENEARVRMSPGEISALRLAETESEARFQDRFIQLMRIREGVDTNPFRIPRAPGWRGSLAVRLKVFLWQLLRYQHDRITFRQNLINSSLGGALEFEHRLRSREIDELRRSVAGLESRLAALEANQSRNAGSGSAAADSASNAQRAK